MKILFLEIITIHGKTVLINFKDIESVEIHDNDFRVYGTTAGEGKINSQINTYREREFTVNEDLSDPSILIQIDEAITNGRFGNFLIYDLKNRTIKTTKNILN
jgi:hypothetical protein